MRAHHIADSVALHPDPARLRFLGRLKSAPQPIVGKLWKLLALYLL
jgi:hypothetical protein